MNYPEQKMVNIKVHRKFDKHKDAMDSGFIHIVSVPWNGQHNDWWNEACADVVEVFGLPGSKFMYHPSFDKMDFHFKSEKNAELCKILLSERLTS
jgi:hypothetical protein